MSYFLYNYLRHNCDSQLPMFKSKNKKSSRRDYLREHIKETVIQQIKDGSLII